MAIGHGYSKVSGKPLAVPPATAPAVSAYRNGRLQRVVRLAPPSCWSLAIISMQSERR